MISVRGRKRVQRTKVKKLKVKKRGHKACIMGETLLIKDN